MKTAILIASLLFSANVFAQNEAKISNIFLRVYDLHDKKIGKGKIISMSDQSLQLRQGGGYIEIPATNIGSVKTKRSPGHNIGIGAAVGAGTTAILFAGSSSSGDLQIVFSGGEILLGAALGGCIGGIIGGVTIPFKNAKSYEINGDMVKWKAFMKEILN